MSGESQRLELHGKVVYAYRKGEAPRCVVVYVHGHVPRGEMRGYKSSADRAWERCSLQEQFDAGGVDATFLVIEAQRSDDDDVPWPDLGALLDAAGVQSPVAAIGHSGAYGTILRWLHSPHLKHVALIDALYGGEDRFRAFALEPGRTLTLIAATEKPEAHSRNLIRGIPSAKRASMVVEVPEVPEALRAEEVEAPIFYVSSSRHGHSELILDKKVIPAVLPRAVYGCVGAR